MTYLLIAIVLLTFLIYKLIIQPLRIRASYAKMFRAHGYKVYQLPFSLLNAPFIEDWFQTQKTKKDCNYSGKHIYSDGYDDAISNVFMRPEVIFFNEKLIKGLHDKDLQMKTPKFNLGFQILYYMIKKGVVFIQNNVWRHRRRIYTKLFNFEFIGSQIPTMIKSAEMMFQKFQEEYWQKHPEDRKQKKVKFSLYQLISKYTSSIIMAGFIGMDSMKQQLKGKTIQEQILKLTDESLRLSRDPLNMMFGQKFLKLGLRKMDREFISYNKEIDQILGSFIKKYREQHHKNKEKPKKPSQTIIQLIFQQIQKEKNSGNKETQIITDEDLIHDIKTFVIAGTDTTSNYLTMLLLYIHQNNEVLEKLKHEISLHIKSDQDITLENFKKIKYLDHVMAQGSRLFGAAETGFQRLLVEDTVICDIPLKKGTCINLYTRPLFNNPSIFKDPLAFKPERWQAQTEENKRLLQLLSFQFYGGPRGCLGKHLALTETKVGIIKFLRRYKSLVEPGKNNRAFQFQVTGHLVNSEVQLQRN